MIMLLTKKTLWTYIITSMVLFITILVNDAFGVGGGGGHPPCPICYSWGYDDVLDEWGCYIWTCGNQQCCNGTCFDPSTKGCCNGVTYDLSSQACCGGAIQTKGGCMGCVNDNWVSLCDSSQCQTCVDGNCKSCNEADPNKDCCNGECYDPATQGCCNGEIYDPNTEKCCCNGTPLPKCKLTDGEVCADPCGHYPPCNWRCTYMTGDNCLGVYSREYKGWTEKICSGGCPGECESNESVCYIQTQCQTVWMPVVSQQCVGPSPAGGCKSLNENNFGVWCFHCDVMPNTQCSIKRQNDACISCGE